MNQLVMLTIMMVSCGMKVRDAFENAFENTRMLMITSVVLKQEKSLLYAGNQIVITITFKIQDLT